MKKESQQELNEEINEDDLSTPMPESIRAHIMSLPSFYNKLHFELTIEEGTELVLSHFAKVDDVNNFISLIKENVLMYTDTQSLIWQSWDRLQKRNKAIIESLK